MVCKSAVASTDGIKFRHSAFSALGDRECGERISIPSLHVSLAASQPVMEMFEMHLLQPSLTTPIYSKWLPTLDNSSSTSLPSLTSTGEWVCPSASSRHLILPSPAHLLYDDLPFWSVFPSQRLKTPRLYIEDTIFPNSLTLPALCLFVPLVASVWNTADASFEPTSADVETFNSLGSGLANEVTWRTC